MGAVAVRLRPLILARERSREVKGMVAAEITRGDERSLYVYQGGALVFYIRRSPWSAAEVTHRKILSL